MNLIMWQKQMVKKISPRNLIFAILGKALITFTLGLFLASPLAARANLANIGKMALFLGIAVLLNSMTGIFLAWHTQKEQKYIDFSLGFFGLFLILFYCGLQFPDVLGKPALWTLLGFGIVLLLPGLWEMVRKRQKTIY